MSGLRERVVPVVSVLGRAVKVRRSRYRGWKPICGFEGSIPSRLTTFPSHPANNLRTRIVGTLTGIEPWSKLGRTAAPLRADVAAIACRSRCSQEDIWQQHPPNGRRVPAVPPRRVGPGEMGGR